MYFESEKSPETSVGDAAAAPETPVEDAAPAPEAPLGAAPDALRAALEKRGFEQLTAVQQAVADADDGARDLRISSQTGSGKTVAIGFALAAKLVDPDRAGPTTLIIAPTRELAMQVRDELSWLFAGLPDVRCEVVTGGTNLDRERIQLRRRPAVLVGTPGRLLDHLRRGGLDASSVRQLVLDEADQMLDLGFKDELDGILEHLPEQRRTHLVSATFPRAVLELADRFQDHALRIEGTAEGEQHADIEHVACRIGPREHYQATVNLLLLAGEERTLVFVRTREETARMADKLAADGFGALPLNGDLAQTQRTRTLNAFRNGSIKVLVATDVAARGIDVPSVTMVVHVDLPIDAATYVHRSGRTGRAGQKGRSVLLVPKVRAGRSHRMFDHIGIEPRWTWPPSPQTIAKKQLERAEEAATTTLTAGVAATPEKRASAANLLQERDPVEVVAMLLGKSITAPRQPFELLPPQPPAPSADGPRLGKERRGEPGAGPSWKDGPQPAAKRPERGFVRFRINWGARGGANPRRILAHVCRRGGVDNRQVGSISMSTTSSTFEVAHEVADEFARRVQRRDKRDPHLVIHRETFARGGGQRAGASRTKQSR
ncbi:MAG: DEAD/DEAH box helicase [Planctomycetota bacterium]